MPHKGKQVSKMLSLYESGEVGTIKKTMPSRKKPSRTEVKKEVVRLNNAGQSMPSWLQEELFDFDYTEMNEVKVNVKQVLPTEKGKQKKSVHFKKKVVSFVLIYSYIFFTS